MTAYFAASELDAFFEQLDAVWGKRPHVFRQPFSKPAVTENDYWGLLNAWAREVRAGRRFSHPRWIEENLLPEKSDGGIREELYVKKRELTAKLEGLTAVERAIFAPLGLV